MSRLLRLVTVCAAVFAWHTSAGDASAAAVQQVQSGTAVNSANGIQTIAISSIDPAKSFLIFETRHDSNRPVGSVLRGRLASATTIQFERVTNGAAPEPAPITIQWYVVSFSSGVRVQRGEVAQSATTVNVPIAAVAGVNQAFVLWSKTAAAADATWGSDDPVLGELTTTTNLQFRTDGVNTAHTIAWQVVEFTNPADINVQKGSITTMTGATTSVTATLSPAVNMGKTFVLAGWRTSGTGAIGSRMLRARLTSPTTVTIDRSTAGAPDNITEIVWQAIELKDNSVVVGGSSSFAAGVPSATVQLVPPVAANRALAFGSGQSGGGQNMGTSPYAGDDVTGVGSFTADLGIAFRSAASASAGSGALTLSIPRPAGTAEFDVMVASIGFRPNTAVVTPPPGWTLVRRTDNAAASANSLAVYWKMAEVDDPASYDWTFNTSTGSAGGILSFVNVDTVNPIDVENGQTTANGLTHAAPSVTTTRGDEMIVSAHGFSSSATWTPPAGLTEAVDIASETVPNCCGIAIAINYGLQSAAGPTGLLAATASGDADVGNAHTLALRPAATSKYLTLTRTSTVDAADLGWFVVQFDQGPGFKVGSFTKSTGAAPATQAIAHGLGSVPKAIILWTNGQTNETFTNASYLLGFGMSDGTISRSVAAASQTGQAIISNASTRMAGKALTLVQWGEVLVAEADLQSWDETSFTLRWTTNNATPYVINYLVIGGPDVSAKVIEWTMAGAAGNRSVTGVGFRPNAVLHAHGTHAFTAALPANIAGAGFGLGAMDADGDQWSTAFFTVDNSATSDTQRGQQTDAAIYSFNNGLAVQKKASWVSMDPDGFTVNFTTAAAGAARVASLALKGVNVKPGSFLKTTGAAPAAQTIGGVGFQPTAVLLTSVQDVTRATPVNHSRFGIGGSDGVSQSSSAITDQNGVTTTSVRAVNKTSKAFIVADTNNSTIGAEANLASLDSDGFTLNWTTNNAVQTEILYLAVAPLAMTEVRLVSFTASRDARGVRLAWETGYESDNLGFHLYRDIDGQRVRITRSLIAGSGLSAGPGTISANGRTYSYWDRDPAGQAAEASYWLEDVDFNGRTTWHGPVRPGDMPAGVVPADDGGSRTIESLARESRRRQERFLTDAPGAAVPPASPWAPGPGPARGALEKQWEIAAGPAVKIGVRSAGWYRVSHSALLAAGLNAAVDPRTLRLYADGVELPMQVSGEADGRLDPGDALEFFGEGVDTAFTDARIYWLVSEPGPALRLRRAEPASGPSSAPSFWRTVERKDRSIYFAALQNGEAENWFGGLISTAEPVDVDVTLLHPEGSASTAASLQVVLQGVTTTADGAPHRVGVRVNGIAVGEVVFAGRGQGIATLPVPHELLVDGTNYVQLRALGGDDDLTLFDTLRLSYWHTYHADDDRLRLTVQGGSQVEIGGFSEAGIRVVDITVPADMLELPTTRGAGPYSVSVVAPGPGVRTLLAFTPSTTFAPVFVAANAPSSLHRLMPGHDYVVISHPAFLDEARSLVALRADEGLHPLLVSAEDVYDEFSFGQKSPDAIKAFVRRAHSTWARPLRHVVLVGDATFDPRDYSELGDGDFIPTKLVDMRSVELETASDDWFVDLDDDGLPELPIGRLPARTPAQAARMVSSIVDYAQAPDGTWAKQVVLVSDSDGAVATFRKDSARLQSLLPPTYTSSRLDRDALGTAALRDELFGHLAQGRLLVNYLGHGSTHLWGERGDLMTRVDLGSRWSPPVSQLPFVITMNCLNGFFHGIYDEESFAEALMRRGGAVAVWASSSPTNAASQAAMNRELYRLLFEGSAETLGDAVTGAKRAVRDSDVRRSWLFFGDPAMRLKGVPFASGRPAATVAVPAVTMRSRAAAEASIAGASLTLGRSSTAPSETVPAGWVIEQWPAAGTVVAIGSAIELTVSSGAAAGQAASDAERPDTGAGQNPGPVLSRPPLSMGGGGSRTGGAVEQAPTAANGAPGSRGAPQAGSRTGSPTAESGGSDAVRYSMDDEPAPAAGSGVPRDPGGRSSPPSTTAMPGEAAAPGSAADAAGGAFGYSAADDGSFALRSGSRQFQDRPLRADFDGDGRLDTAVYRQATGEWFILHSSDGRVQQLKWGVPALSDAPVPADYDGDGRADVAVYRHSTGEWFVLRSSKGSVYSVRWGVPSLDDAPVPSDFDGDGRADIAVYRGSTGRWYVMRSSVAAPRR